MVLLSRRRALEKLCGLIGGLRRALGSCLFLLVLFSLVSFFSMFVLVSEEKLFSPQFERFLFVLVGVLVFVLYKAATPTFIVFVSGSYLSFVQVLFCNTTKNLQNSAFLLLLSSHFFQKSIFFSSL